MMTIIDDLQLRVPIDADTYDSDKYLLYPVQEAETHDKNGKFGLMMVLYVSVRVCVLWSLYRGCFSTKTLSTLTAA